jgi:hypothetical protein
MIQIWLDEGDECKSLEGRDLRKGSLAVVLGIVFVISSFLIPFHLFLPAWVQEEDSYTIKPKERRSISIHSLGGSVVRGMLLIQEGNISLSLEDSNGNVIVAEGEVNGEYLFGFQASSADSFVLFLDNSDGSAEKRVDWTIWMYFYNILSLLYGISVSVVGSLAVLRERMTNAKIAGALQDIDVSLKPISVRLVKTGSAIRMTVPRQIADHLGLREEDTVTVYVSNRNMVVRKS